MVSPVIACFVAVYGALLGLGTWAEIDPLLMIRPPEGSCVFIKRNACPGTQERAGEVHVHDTLPILDFELVDGYRRRHRARIVEQQIEAAVIGAHPVEEGRDRSGLAHIGGDGRAGPAQTLALGGGFGQELCSSSHGPPRASRRGRGPTPRRSPVQYRLRSPSRSCGAALPYPRSAKVGVPLPPYPESRVHLGRAATGC